MEKELSFYADLLWIKNRAAARNELDNVSTLLKLFPKLADTGFIRVVEAYSELRRYYSTNCNLEELQDLLSGIRSEKKTLM